MRAALTPPFAAAALVLCIAGAAKLRSPDGAVRALVVLGIGLGFRAARVAVRGLAVGELALGAWCVVAPSRIGAALLAVLYAGFAVVAGALARRRAACGCFGATQTPASAVQSALSLASAAVGVACALSPPFGAGWMFDRGAASAVGLVAGIAGCAYALVVAYTDLPAAWAAWSAR